MVLYVQDNNPRIQYISTFIGGQVIGENFEITTDQDYFRSYDGPKLNYSNNKLSENEFWLLPHSIIFETGTREHPIDIFEFENTIAFFKTGGDISFDIFAASFYLLSRYEEYLPHAQDMYERYAHENSIAFREGFLDRPLVDEWILVFRQKLATKFPSIKLVAREFCFLPTYDIDEPYSYRHKSVGRNIAGLLKALFKGKWSQVKERLRVLRGLQKDPYDSFETIDEMNRKYQLNPVYFFLVAERTGQFDRHIPPFKQEIKKLIEQHSSRYDTGVHPSWQSGHTSGLLKKEIDTLEKITGKKIASSRQHYIHFSLPETYRQLAEAGIENEYSMGYGSINGFRASVATTFLWYDIGEERVTNLRIFPFCFMEANSFFEQHFSAEEALQEMIKYYETVKSVGGTFIPIWHNTFLGSAELFKGWKECYAAFLMHAARK